MTKHGIWHVIQGFHCASVPHFLDQCMKVPLITMLATVQEFIHGRMEIVTRANSTKTSVKARERFILPMGMYILVTLLMVSLKEMENTYLKVVNTMAVGSVDVITVLEHWSFMTEPRTRENLQMEVSRLHFMDTRGDFGFG